MSERPLANTHTDKQLVVSFRLTTSFYQELKLRAQSCGLSPGAFVRVWVLDMLSNSHGEDARETIEQIHLTLQSLMKTVVTKSDHATAVSALLVAAGIENDRAQAWVKQNLLSQRGTP
jgi:hypothetical protein